jgi:hypothetical protein
VPSYTVGYIDVYRNGVRLVSTDYTATTGTTVVLNNACTVGDAVVTESFLVSSVLNAIPATAGSVSDSYIVSMAGSKLTGSRSIPNSTMPAGTVLQVVSFSTTAALSTTGTTLITTGVTASITPSSTTSKVLVFASLGLYNSANASVGTQLYLYKNGSSLTKFTVYANYTSTAVGLLTQYANNYLDSPATTSSTTYTIYFCSTNSGSQVNINTNGELSSITLMEIAA